MGTLDADTVRSEVEAARDLFQRGSPARSRQRFRAILSRLEGLADPLPEIEASHARLLLGLAAAEFEVTGDFDEAMGLLRRAAVSAERAGATELTAPIHGQRGLLLLRRGETDRALRALDEAVASFDVAPDYDKMTLLLNRGTLHLERGALEAASADFTDCVALARSRGERLLEYKASHNLGYVEFLAGRLPRALAALEAAERINPTGDAPIAMLDRARVLREAGLAREADDLLTRVSRLFAQSRLVQDLAETDLVRAECALVEGRAQQARALAASAHRRFARRQNLRWQRRAELMLLRADRALAEEREPRARRTALRGVADRATALLDACRREDRRDLARSARMLAQECRLRAGDERGPGLPSMRGIDTLQARLHAREVRALAAEVRGDRRRALTEVRRGLAELGQYQHSFGSLDLRTASAVHGASLARLGLEVALRSASPAVVFRVVELARAVSTRLPQVRPPSDERTAELVSRLRQVEEEARALEGDPAAGDRLEHLRLHAGHLQRDIRGRAWELEGSDGAAAEAPRLAQVRAAAREAGVAFVTLARHAGRWVAVCVCGGRARVVDLAAVADVAELVTRARADLDALAVPVLPPALRDTVGRSLSVTLGRLDDLLLRPLRVSGRPLVMSCTGDLMFVPWGLLPSRAGLPTVVTPSAATWLRGQAAGRPVSRPDRVTVASLAGPGLHRAAEEAHRVAALWEPAARTRVVSGAAATAGAAHEALVSADVVHVAAHGVHRQDNPLFSFVRMADGPLYAHEIDPTGGRLARCVVLSACEAGLSTLRPGDESLGLAHVLLQLGTTSVIAGVARVSDDVAAKLMETVHQAMARGADAASALAEGQLDTLSGDSPVAFVCFGATW